MPLPGRRIALLVVVLALAGVGTSLLLPGAGPATRAAVARPAPVEAPRAAAPVVRKPALKPHRVKVAPVTVAPRRTVARPLVRPVVHRSIAAPVAVVRTETPNQRGQRVLASLHYNWQRMGYRIVFLPERQGYLGFTDGGTKTVTIWVRRSETDLVLAHSIAHELGHVLDFTQGSAAKHAAYLALRNLNPTTSWYGCNGCTDYRTPAGDWAEVFAYWLAGPGDFRSQLGPPPSATRMKAIAQLYKF
ncbi:MAG: hypothetical protein JWL79_1971 [Frankiales bacterium]|jgi:hypothetical protein|nr:hypothetical protein [Frankiales bacterium]